VQHEVSGEAIHANMFVPTDLLNPILDGMLQTGRSPHPPHPWLGMSTQDSEGRLLVSKLAPGGPADRAGVQIGDMVLSVGALRVTGLAEFFRAVWRLGSAGVEVPLTVGRDGDVLRMTVKSADRSDFLKKPKLH
jgi:S1-C subfamily serine protease